MNDYIRSALLVLNTGYPGYLFDIDDFNAFVILWCKHQFRNENDEIYETDTMLIRTRIETADLSHERIVEEGKRLMNKINREKFNKCYYGMWPDKYYIVPKELIFQDEKTTVINWTDGTKTIVKCSDDDVFSPEAGVALCYMKKFVTDNDSERFHRLLKGLISISKFKNSKQEHNISLLDCSEVITGIINKLWKMEEKNDINSRTPDNSGDNDPDCSAVEVES